MTKTLLRVGVCAASLLLFVVACAKHRAAAPQGPALQKVGKSIPPALARKLAQMAKFAPAVASEARDAPESFAEQDWLEKNTDGQGDGPAPFTAFAQARNDWFGLKARVAVGTGHWTPYGPTNGINDMNNLFRDRSVYNAGTENFSGRTVHAVIAPDCQPAPGECNLWIANANGGVWWTEQALAEDDPTTAEYEGPVWEYLSETFEQNNVSSLELDPNDANYKTIWAGTGEPNACGSGCEVGVGVYLSKSGGQAWTGPLGAQHFFGRGVGSIEVKPGDSDTVFVASGRATRGISNTCCGGTDALIPGAPHFGVFRSQNRGKTWELVNQGANALCTASTPDAVSLNTTACSPRGARRVKIDPVDPNTVYASFFARGIWRSIANGDPGTWEQIMAPVGGANTNERAEFDVVALASGETRMYVGVGGGAILVDPPGPPPPALVAQYARFRRNENVRSAPAATVAASWIDLTSNVPDTPGYSSFGFCDPQCSYDAYVYAPSAHAPNSGATPDTVYLLGDNEYNENNHVTGRSNGRAVLVSTDAGATFTDLTEDSVGGSHPGALHPDHHALLVNPLNWMQFFSLGDGGVSRSNGVFVNDSADCTSPPKSLVVPSRIAFCQMVLSRVPQRLTAINRGLRTLHFYQVEYDRTNPERLAGGTQDNGSWETINDKETWLNVNVADGGHNAFDAPGPGRDPNYALTAWQQGTIEVRYNPLDQFDVQWSADTMFYFYAAEGVPFIGNAITDPVQPGWIWHGREHVFRSTNWGRNPVMTKDQHRLHCNVWVGDGDVDEDGTYEIPDDVCDDFKPLGDPGPNGRLTSPVTYGTDRAGGHVAVVERAYSDTNTLWVATSTGRVFISKNADNPVPTAVTFIRLDSTDTDDPPRYPTAIFVDRANPNHAWITYSGYSSKTPNTPGHVFEVSYNPGTSPSDPPTATFTNRDGHKNNGYGDIPANSIIVTNRGTVYVGNDYGVVMKEPNSTVWKRAPAGLPNVNVADLVYVPEKDALYAATHGQGIWQLKVQ